MTTQFDQVQSTEGTPTNNEIEELNLLEGLITRQNEVLERIESHLEEEAEEQEQMLRRLLTRGVSIVTILGGLILGGYEFSIWLADEWNKRNVFENWLEVARTSYEDENNAKVALRMIQGAEAIDPQSAELVRLKAYIEGMETVEVLFNLDRPMNQKEVDRAGVSMGQADMLLQVEPDKADGYILKGQLYAALDQLDRAQLMLDKAIEIDPKNSFAWVRRGVVKYKKYNLMKDKALQFEAKNDNEAAKKQKEESLKNLTGALYALEKAAKLDPESKWPPLWLGKIEFEAKDNNEAAKKQWEKALKIDPRFTLAMQNISYIHLHAGDFVSHERQLWDMLKLEPENVHAWYGLALNLGYQDDYRAALVYAKIATDKDPGSFEAWNMRGLLAYEIFRVIKNQTGQIDEGMVGESISSYSKGIELNPRAAEAYLRRSTLNLAVGKMNQAGDDSRQAIKFEPLNSEAHVTFADLQFELGLYAQALTSYIEAQRISVELNGYDHEMAILGQAKVLAKLSRREEADTTFRQAIDAAQTEGGDLLPTTLTHYAEFLRMEKKNDLALKHLQTARNQDPEYFEAWAAEADLLLFQGNLMASSVAIAQCLLLAPESNQTRELRTRLEKAQQSQSSKKKVEEKLGRANQQKTIRRLKQNQTEGSSQQSSVGDNSGKEAKKIESKRRKK